MNDKIKFAISGFVIFSLSTRYATIEVNNGPILKTMLNMPNDKADKLCHKQYIASPEMKDLNIINLN